MTKFCVDIQIVANKTLTIEAPNAGVIEEFFDGEDEYVTRSILENSNSSLDILSIGDIGDIKPVKKGDDADHDPDFCVNADCEAEAYEPEK